MKRFLVGVALVTGSLVLASPTGAAAQQPQRGGVFRLGIAEPGSSADGLRALVPVARAVRRGGDQPAPPT